jgi:spore coat polysaccharide biosynthesis protein SpsF
VSPPVTVVVQARLSSRRLPGKVLAPLAGAPALARMLERVGRVRHATRVVVATSVEPSDDGIVALCEGLGVPTVRGSLDDVLGRFVAAVPGEDGAVVRLTGDCPLIDPTLVDRHIERYLRDERLRYVTNAVRRTQPDGLDVEVMSAALLRRAHREATSGYDREHVTPWIQRHVGEAATAHLTQETDLSALRWTLDTAEDLAFIAGVYDALWPAEPTFAASEVYRLLCEEPHRILTDDEPLTADARAAWVERIRAHLETVSVDPEGRTES